MDSDSDTSYEYDTDDDKVNYSHYNHKNKQIRKKRKNNYNKEWEAKFNWLKKSSLKGDEYAKCIACNCEFKVSNGGLYDVKRHGETPKHITNNNAAKKSNIEQYLNSSRNSATDLEKKTIAAESTFVYHTVYHSQSYNSATCSSNLFNTLFADSQIAAKFTCAKTKCSRIARLLGKEIQMEILQDLRNNHPFSVATDASNKGNIKTFPLVVTYFCKSKGVQNKLLKFYDLPSETSKDIAASLISHIEGFGLRPQDVISYCADNASVNFGQHQSVFTELRNYNNNLLNIGCICHMLHNAVKKASNNFVFDIEMLIIKCFNEFSSHTKRRQSLLLMYQFCDMEYLDLLRHVPTRWLTLLPAINRLYKCFEPIKGYFLSKDNCSPLLKKFFECDLAEAYLGFFSNVATEINEVIKKLEGEEALIIELYEIISNLKNSITQRLQEKYYGHIALQKLKACVNENEIQIFEKSANAFLESLINYIEKHFTFENNIFEKLYIFKLQTCPRFSEFIDVIESFHIPFINKDALFNEYVVLKSKFDLISTSKPEKKWMDILKFDLPNFEKIINFIFCIPHANAISERAFSLMLNTWRKERNKLSIESVEAELLIKFNNNKKCKEMFDHILQNQTLLQKLKSSDKYETCI